MNTTAYEALLEEQRATPDEISRRRDAARLADIARNLESLNELARVEASDDSDTRETAATGVARTEDR
jgi:hypothetical protein